MKRFLKEILQLLVHWISAISRVYHSKYVVEGTKNKHLILVRKEELMMTSTQVEYLKSLESERHNRASENETERHNKRTEETDRWNAQARGLQAGTATIGAIVGAKKAATAAKAAGAAAKTAGIAATAGAVSAAAIPLAIVALGLADDYYRHKGKLDAALKRTSASQSDFDSLSDIEKTVIRNAAKDRKTSAQELASRIDAMIATKKRNGGN